MLPNLIVLKDSPYVGETMKKMDGWKKQEFSKGTLTPEGNQPQFMIADCRPDDPEEFNKLLGKPFIYREGDREMTTDHFVGLSLDGEVNSYFHHNIEERANGTKGATCVHCYNLGATSFLFGKYQKEFYDYLTETFDYIEILIPADSPYSNGDVNGKGVEPSPELRAIMERRFKETGYHNPHLINRAIKHNGTVTPYCIDLPDMDGNHRLHHIIRWLGKPGIEKGLPNHPVLIRRPDSLKAVLRKLGITEYL